MKTFGLILKGMGMGIAEVIPGVSGGTIAFITGIYETLIQSIKAIDGAFIKDLINFRFQSAFKAINGLFLVKLVVGMVLGIGVGIFGVSYLLENYPVILWSFFFGLILLSVFYILAQVEKLNLGSIGFFILGTVIALAICMLSPIEGSTNPLFLVLAGSIAISALILPGISGSFMLLLMGMYSIVVPALRNVLVDFSMDQLKIILFFALGCIIGLVLFSRILTWTFKHYKNQTFGLLSGFMLGSLYKIWPWRHPTIILNKTTGTQESIDSSSLNKALLHNEEIKILQEKLVLPQHYFEEPYLLICIFMALLGALVVLALWKFGQSSN